MLSGTPSTPTCSWTCYGPGTSLVRGEGAGAGGGGGRRWMEVAVAVEVGGLRVVFTLTPAPPPRHHGAGGWVLRLAPVQQRWSTLAQLS